MDNEELRKRLATCGMSRREFLEGSLAVAGVSLLGLGLAGCSSAGTNTSATSSAATSEGYSLIKQGVIQVAWSDAAPPMENTVAATGQPEGYDVDMMHMLCEKLGVTCEYLAPQKFDTLIPMIKAGGKADVACAMFTITDVRKEEIDFSDPYMNSNQGLVVRADSSVTTYADLNTADHKLAVMSGTTGSDWAKENIPNATFAELDDLIQCLTGVQTGLYEASVYDLPSDVYEINTSYSNLKVAESEPTGEQYGIVISKDNPGLTAALNEALGELRDAGTLSELEVKWFGQTVS